MRVLQILSFGIIAYFISVSLFATSCSRLANEYYLLCDQGKCSKGVESFKVPTSPYCSRLSEVGVAPDWVLRFAEKVLETKEHEIGSGIIKVIDFKHYSRHKRVESFDEFVADKFGSKAYSSTDKKKEAQAAMFSELLSTLDRTSKDWFTLHSDNASVEELDEINDLLLVKARNRKLKFYAYWAIYLVVAFIVVVTFIWSINSFYSRLHQREAKSLLNAVKLPLAIQFILLLVSLPIIFISFVSFAPMIMLLPAIFFVLLAELTQLLLLKFRKP